MASPRWVPDDAFIHAGDIGQPAEGHGQIQFIGDDLQDAADACFAQGAQAVQIGAADHGAAGAQRKSLEDVLARADTAIQPDFDVVADGVDDGRQGLDTAGRAVELAAAVIGHDQGVGATGYGQACIGRFHDALKYQLAAPARLDPRYVVPVEGGVELAGRPLPQILHVGGTFGMTDDVSEVAASGPQHTQAPARLAQHV